MLSSSLSVSSPREKRNLSFFPKVGNKVDGEKTDKLFPLFRKEIITTGVDF